METENKSKALSKELRIALSSEATLVYEKMVDLLKKEIPTIKLHPSQVVSFLVMDFFVAHFEKDKDILIAEFFDSDAYYQAARRKAKGSPEYEDLMAKALTEAKAIKAKKRRQAAAKSNRTHKDTDGMIT